eukprot:1160963-Pelagomonas_calceolata.AAC.3
MSDISCNRRYEGACARQKMNTLKKGRRGKTLQAGELLLHQSEGSGHLKLKCVSLAFLCLLLMAKNHTPTICERQGGYAFTLQSRAILKGKTSPTSNDEPAGSKAQEQQTRECLVQEQARQTCTRVPHALAAPLKSSLMWPCMILWQLYLAHTGYYSIHMRHGTYAPTSQHAPFMSFGTFDDISTQ